MKRIFIALMVAMTLCSLTMVQAKTTIAKDNISKTAASSAVTVSSDSTFVAEYEDVVDTSATDDVQSKLVNLGDDSDFSFNLGNNPELLIPITAIIVTCFLLPVMIIFIAFFFAYKNRKAKYHLVEQALASGQPLPEGIFKEVQQMDLRTKGIKNICLGIGLFIFLWGITGEFGIGCIGLLVMFTGLGQWLTTRNRQATANKDPFAKNLNDEPRDEQK